MRNQLISSEAAAAALRVRPEPELWAPLFFPYGL